MFFFKTKDKFYWPDFPRKPHNKDSFICSSCSTPAFYLLKKNIIIIIIIIIIWHTK